MPTYVSGGSSKTFTPAPIGAYQAVCCDVVDRGLVQTAFGEKRKVDLKWQIGEDMDNGKPFIVNKRYTASLHEKANLRRDLEAWRGRAFTEAELKQFDMDTLVGANCILNVVQNTDDKGRVWANVASITPLMRGLAKMTPRDYERESTRKPDTAVAEVNDATHDGDDDSMPF